MRKWIIILLLIVGGPAAIVLNYNKNQDIAALQDHGKTATAQIQKIEWRKKYGMTSSYKLLINFSTDTNQSIDSKIDVSNDIGKSAADGKITGVNVKYLPENPQTVYLAETGPSDDMYYGGGAAFVIGVIVLIFALRRR